MVARHGPPRPRNERLMFKDGRRTWDEDCPRRPRGRGLPAAPEGTRTPRETPRGTRGGTLEAPLIDARATLDYRSGAMLRTWYFLGPAR